MFLDSCILNHASEDFNRIVANINKLDIIIELCSLFISVTLHSSVNISDSFIYCYIVTDIYTISAGVKTIEKNNYQRF